MKDLMSLPTGLPVPKDDGACDHLEGMSLPALTLQTTAHRELNLYQVTQPSTVIFFYPRTGQPDQPTPVGWDLIPGARGCTPQSCGFRDLQGEFLQRGYQVFGASSQTTAYQQEFVERNHIPFEILSDANFALTDALRLPTFEYNGVRLIKRLALIVEASRILKVFYPVFPPDRNAQTILDWIDRG